MKWRKLMKIFVFISCFSFFLSQPVRPSVISLGDFLVVQAVFACLCVVQLLWSDCVTWLPVYWWQTMMTLSSVRAGGSHRRRTGPGNKIWYLTNIGVFLICWSHDSERHMREGRSRWCCSDCFWHENVVCRGQMGECQWKTVGENCSQGSGEEWDRGNNVYQDMVCNNWDIMGSVTSV